MRRLKNFLLLFPVQTSLRFNNCGNKQNIALQEFPRLLYSEVAVSATMYFLFSNERHLDSFALFRSNNRKPSGKQNIYSYKYFSRNTPSVLHFHMWLSHYISMQNKSKYLFSLLWNSVQPARFHVILLFLTFSITDSFPQKFTHWYFDTTCNFTNEANVLCISTSPPYYSQLYPLISV